MNPEQRYERHKTTIERYLRNFISEHKPRSLYYPAKYVLAAGGKRIRPVVTLLACEAVGGKRMMHSMLQQELKSCTILH